MSTDNTNDLKRDRPGTSRPRAGTCGHNNKNILNSTTPASTGQCPVDMLAAALAYTAAGISVIPTDPASKRPASSLLPKGTNGQPGWKTFQTKIASQRILQRWFGNNSQANIAIVCGQVSGGLFCIDFDQAHFYDAWLATVGHLAQGLCVQRTGKGFHVIGKIAGDPGGNQKLAFVPDDNEQSSRRVAIETRGEGGYFQAAPSLHDSGRRYQIIAGGMTNLPTISQAHYDVLLDAARRLDQAPKTRQQQQAERHRATPSTASRQQAEGCASVIDTYNQANPIETTLLRYGYTARGRGYVRPGGEHVSVYILDNGRSYHHNTNDPLCDSHSHDAFDLFCHHEHGGDVRAAVRAAAQAMGIAQPARERATGTAATTPGAPGNTYAQTLPHSRSSGRLCSDLGNGQRLADAYGDQLRFTEHLGWLWWDGKRWCRDETGETARRAKATTLAIFDEAVEATGHVVRAIEAVKRATEHGNSQELERAAEAQRKTQDRANTLSLWAMRAQAKARIDAMIALAQSEPIISAHQRDFDRDPYLLNCMNGILDLRTGQLAPHNPLAMMTKLAGTSYDPAARCPTWLDFLNRIMANQADLIAFLQRAIGYTLTGVTNEQCLFFEYGSGANGKSTMTEIITSMLGEYATKTPTETLVAKNKDASGIPNDLARLPGARMVVAAELSDRRLNEGLVKDLTGGDTITARFLHREFFEFVPMFKLWMYGNHKPTIRGTDDGIWRRIKLIPFAVTIPENERDPNLPAKLRAELPGILAWAVEGCLAWQREKLNVPATIRNATASYRAEMDVLGAFIDERCIQATNAKAKKADFYQTYKAWCESYGEIASSQRQISMRMQERGFTEHKGTLGDRFWLGISLIEKEEKQL